MLVGLETRAYTSINGENMDPITITFALAGIAGAIFEANGQKQISQKWLEENFGSAAYAKEFNQQLANLQATTYGQELLNSAMAQGQQLSNTIRANAAASGFGGPEGVQSGASIFATSAGEGASFNLRRQAMAGLAQQADARTQDAMKRKYEALAPGQLGQTGLGKFGSILRQAAPIAISAREAQLDRNAAKAAAAPVGSGLGGDNAYLGGKLQVVAVDPDSTRNPDIKLRTPEPMKLYVTGRGPSRTQKSFINRTYGRTVAPKRFY